jgi:hypothetical protein
LIIDVFEAVIAITRTRRSIIDVDVDVDVDEVDVDDAVFERKDDIL